MEFNTVENPLQEQPFNIEQVGGEYFSNVKRIRSGDGSFLIANGKIELRDSSGNIIVLIDANG